MSRDQTGRGSQVPPYHPVLELTSYCQENQHQVHIALRVEDPLEDSVPVC